MIEAVLLSVVDVEGERVPVRLAVIEAVGVIVVLPEREEVPEDA